MYYLSINLNATDTRVLCTKERHESCVYCSVCKVRTFIWYRIPSQHCHNIQNESNILKQTPAVVPSLFKKHCILVYSPSTPNDALKNLRHVSVSYSGHGDNCPPKAIRDGFEIGLGWASFCEVHCTREQDHTYGIFERSLNWIFSSFEVEVPQCTGNEVKVTERW